MLVRIAPLKASVLGFRCELLLPARTERQLMVMKRICWDFIGDQPIVAATLSANLHVAYQLVEVRTGKQGMKPLYRTGKAPEGTLEAVRREIIDVLDKMGGQDGATKRAGAEKIRDALIATTQEGGQGRKALISLLDDFEL
jgi:hypothetical protein